MNNVTASLAAILQRIAAAETEYERERGSVTLLAVSKTQPPEAVGEAYRAGQRAFGENQLQDALPKLDAFAQEPLEWHFIGPVQANKTRAIAQRFSWVHSIDRLRIAQRLNEHRNGQSTPLNVCIQVNISDEATKSGVDTEQALPLAREISKLTNLTLRGVMAIPAPVAPAEGIDAQRAALRPLRVLYDELRDAGIGLDTLSMGMTDDLEAAVAEGSTIVRIGTAVFGPRRTPGSR